MTPVWLTVIGLALAWPVPAVLVRARWLLLAPRAAIVLWQALALAAILAMSGAGLSTALWLVTDEDPGQWRTAAHFAVLALGVLVWVRFWWSAWIVWSTNQRRRTRHRHLIDLLSEPHGVLPAVRILAEQTPVAYCLPRRGDSRIVISQGTLDVLGPDELDAILAHERAHVRERHDLVLEGFAFLHRAFPRVLRTDAPLRQSAIMIELLADDAARAKVGSAPVARAIVALIGTPTPVGALGADGTGNAAMIRMHRLADPNPRHPWLSLLAHTISTVVLVAPTVLLAVPWMVHAWQTLAS